jgi:hypothetical protein
MFQQSVGLFVSVEADGDRGRFWLAPPARIVALHAGRNPEHHLGKFLSLSGGGVDVILEDRRHFVGGKMHGLAWHLGRPLLGFAR